MITEIMAKECALGVLIEEDDRKSLDSHWGNASMFKVGVERDGLTPIICKILDAAGEFSKVLEVPCMLHIESGVPFEEIVDYPDHTGLKPHIVMICHMGKSLVPVLFKNLSERGYFLEFDEMIRTVPTLDELAQGIKNLFDQGYGGSVCFAGDLARRSYWTCYGGKPGLAYFISQLEQELLDLGLTKEMLDKKWINNPARLFA